MAVFLSSYFASKGIVGKIESAKEVLFVMTSAAIDTERMNQILEDTKKAITFEKLIDDSTYDVAKQFLPTDYLKYRMRIINVSPANAKQEAEKIEPSENHIPTFFLFARNEAEQGKVKETVSENLIKKSSLRYKFIFESFFEFLLL